MRLIAVLTVVGLAGVSPLAAQGEPPVPAPPPAPPAQVAPWPAAPPAAQAPPAPSPLLWAQTAQAPQPAPAPPVPPARRAPRFIQAPGLLLAPQASQSYLGVHLMEVSPDRARELKMSEPYGVEIMSVAADSPAAQAGIRKGDVIVGYRGQRVEGQEQLVRLVRETPVGRQVAVTVFRGGSEARFDVEIGERKATANALFNCGGEPCEIQIPNVKIPYFDFDFPKPRMVTQSRLLGAELESLEGQLGEYFGVKQGVLVRAVDSNSPASGAGLQAGDVIVEVAGKSVRDAGEIRQAVRSAGDENAVPLAVIRNRSRISIQMVPQARGTKQLSPARPVVNPAGGRF